VAIHTSCSKPIGPGLVFGAYTVVSGSSLDGGPLCAGGDAGKTSKSAKKTKSKKKSKK
jgi:hypothetical protein